MKNWYKISNNLFSFEEVHLQIIFLNIFNPISINQFNLGKKIIKNWRPHLDKNNHHLLKEMCALASTTFFPVLVAYGKQLLLATSWVTQQLRGIELSVASNLRTWSRVKRISPLTRFWNGSGLFVPPDLIEISVVRWIMWDRKDFVILTSNARGAPSINGDLQHSRMAIAGRSH